MAIKKPQNLHIRWVTTVVASLMITFLLWVTGYLNILISTDTLGVTFSILIIYTLVRAKKYQYENIKQEHLNDLVVDEIFSKLDTAKNYDEDLASYIEDSQYCEHSNASINVFFAQLHNMIKLNPEQPLSYNNIEACEAHLEDDFYNRVADEVEDIDLLTKYGMLGTFLGLVVGFSTVDWAALSTDTALTIVGGVVGGVQIALITSILGFIASIFLKKQHDKLKNTFMHTQSKVNIQAQKIERLLCHENSYIPLAKKVGWIKKTEVDENETQ